MKPPPPRNDSPTSPASEKRERLTRERGMPADRRALERQIERLCDLPTEILRGVMDRDESDE